jgi:hypothetical protein
MKTIIKEPNYMGKNRAGFLSLLRFIFLGALLLIGVFVSPECAFGGGAVIKGMAVAAPGQVIVAEPGSTESIDTASPELLEDAVLKKVIQTHPSSFPLDTMISHASKQNTSSWEYEAFDTPYIPYYTTTSAAFTTNTFALSFLSVANIDFIRNGSTLFIKSILGSDGKWLALLVTSVARGATPQIQVMTLNPVTAGYTPAIPNGTEIIIGPIAANELAMQVEQQIPVPQPYGNWNQLFMCQIEQGDYAEAHQKKVDWGWKDMHEYAIMDFRARRSIAYYLGFGGRFVDAVAGVVKYTTKGIYRQIVRQWSAPASWTDADFIDFCQFIFIGNKGSQKRILFAGDQLIANISKAPIMKQQNATSTEVIWGLEFTKIKTNFGSIYTYYDPMLTEMKLSGSGVVIDPEFLVRTNFDGVHYDKLDLKGAGTRRVKAESIAEASSALLRNLDAHVWINT